MTYIGKEKRWWAIRSMGEHISEETHPTLRYPLPYYMASESEKTQPTLLHSLSGFSSFSVLNGYPYIAIDFIGLPSEVAKKIS